MSAAQGLKYKRCEDGYAVVGTGTFDKRKLTVPSMYRGLPVTEIANYAFYDTENVTEIVIPSSVKRIGDLALADCPSLKRLTVPPTVDSLGYYVLKGSTALRKITVSQGDTNDTKEGNDGTP